MKTELSPDKLYYKSHLSGLKRFLMDKHLTLSNLSVNAYLSPDKLHILPRNNCGTCSAQISENKSSEPLKTHQHVTAKTLTNAIKNPALR